MEQGGKKMAKNRLGRGLEALIPAEKGAEDIRLIGVDKIEANPFQPRSSFSQEGIKELAQSIREQGMIQPIALRRLKGGQFQIAAGERRWRAAKEAGLAQVPAVIRDFTEQQMMEVALIENLQREDLTPIEQARAYRRLIKDFNLTQEDVAGRIGKSRSAIANTLRLLNLPEDVQELVSRETISMGHARALLALATRADQEKVALKIISDNLTVRQTEALVKQWGEKKKPENRRNLKTEEIESWEQRLHGTLGTKVVIRPRSETSGSIQVEYRSIHELRKISSLLGGRQ